MNNASGLGCLKEYYGNPRDFWIWMLTKQIPERGSPLFIGICHNKNNLLPKNINHNGNLNEIWLNDIEWSWNWLF